MPAFGDKRQNLNPLQASFCSEGEFEAEEVSLVLGLFLSLLIKVDLKLVCWLDCCSSSDTVLEGVTIKVSPSRVTEELWLSIGKLADAVWVGIRRLRVGENRGRVVVGSG